MGRQSVRAFAAVTLLLLTGVGKADVFSLPAGLRSLDLWSGSFAIAVDGGSEYHYRLARYEVTVAQYTEFLNAVAREDTYGLFSEKKNCGIRRDGAPGNYAYAADSNWANRPVGYVSWCDAARFVNWLANGQPSGGQDNSTTEDGTYALEGDLFDTSGAVRRPGAIWALPSQDEWRVAAGWVGTNGTWNNDAGNDGVANPILQLAGNTWEWTDSLTGNGHRLVDQWGDDANGVKTSRDFQLSRPIGFRVAQIAEPSSGGLALAAFLFAALYVRRRRQKRG